MKIKTSLLLAGVAILAVAMLGCQGEIIVTSVTGDVVNARSDSLAGIEGVTVTYTKVEDNKKQTAITSSGGSYSMTYTGEGAYKVTASKDGWFFIPQTVYVGNWLTNVPDVIGITLDSNSKVRDNAISFILTWNSSYQDLDGFLTFPDGSGTGDGLEGSHYPPSSNEFYDPYSPAPAVSEGFGPDTASREIVGPANIYTSLVTTSKNTVSEVLEQGTDTRPAIELDRDDRNGSGPEVITVRTLPFWPSYYDFTAVDTLPADDTPLPSTVGTVDVAGWTWIGVMEYYVDGWNSDNPEGSRTEDGHLISSQDGSGADAVLHIVQGDDLLGAFSVPDYANIRTASLVRINMFLGEPVNLANDDLYYFQFVPDIRLVDHAGGMGIMSSVDQSPSIFGVSGALDAAR